MKKKNRLFILLLCTSILLILFVILPIDGNDHARFQPSGSPATIPNSHVPFSEYITQNRARIRSALQESRFAHESEPFGAGYTLEKVVDMRSPFELRPKSEECLKGNSPRGTESNTSAQRRAQKGVGKGFLFLHGLSDSPYLLRQMANSLSLQYPCAIQRGLLMPGHGTVPADLLNISYEDWMEAAEYGISSFRDEIQNLYLVGYSNGSSVSLQYVARNPDDDLIAGLIMLSPGVKAVTAGIALTPLLRPFMKWVNQSGDHDAAKYESFPTNAAAQFYFITKDLVKDKFNTLEVPVFMAIAGDDATINAQAAADFFCTKAPEKNRKLVWYKSFFENNTLHGRCEGMQIVDAKKPELNFVNHSHVSITIPVDDSHYGVDGQFRFCGHYDTQSEDYKTCKSDNENSLFGETNLVNTQGKFEGKVVRRATFNPRYDELIDDIVCFVDGECGG